MPGTFLIGEKKDRPGTYFRRENYGGPETVGATNGIGAAIFQADWGPLNKVYDMDLTMKNDIADYFGNDEHTKILREMFDGGAITIRAIRCGDDDGEPSSVTLKLAEVPASNTPSGDNGNTQNGDGEVDDDLDDNTGGSTSGSGDDNTGDGVEDLDPVDEEFSVRRPGTGQLTTMDATLTANPETVAPPDAVTITAAYPGAREFAVSIRTNLITDLRECIIYDGTVIFEKVSFEAGDNEVANLIAALNKVSKNFIAKAVGGTALTGALATVTQVPMTGGKNPTVTTASYDRATNQLERVKWNCLIVDTNNAAVHALVQSFVDLSYEMGHFGIGCIAGNSTQDLDARMSLAASYNDEKMAYVLNGWESNSGAVYDGYLAAARIGGMIASFETNSSITHEVVKGALTLVEPLTNSEIIRAIRKGCLVLSINDSDQIWVEAAINTLVTPDADMDEGWKKLRRTKCRFELMDRVNSTCDKLVGKINNDTDGRQTVMAAAQKVLNTMAGEKKILASSYVFEDPANPAEGDSAWFKLAIDDIDSLEKIYLTYMFRFSANSGTDDDSTSI